jgi:CpeT protein
MKKISSMLFACIIVCTTTAQTQKLKQKDLSQLYKLMTGSYSSQAQSESDSSYFDIRLQIKPMWQNRKDEYWLYVEQAMSTTMDKPYRQRVYRLTQINDSTIASNVYTIKGGDKYFGDYKKTNPLEGLSIDSLEIRNGCAVLLKKINKNKYEGSTNKNDCESSLRGASYATSIVKVGKKKIVSWDQGFDKDNKQVWGAVKGGYIFKKVKLKKIKQDK